MTSAPAKPRRRIFYLDLVRALATVLIVITHFNNPYLVGGREIIFPNTPFGIYIGGLGVSLFLIISGAALAFTYGNREFSLKTFYWKRFKGIYPMFWTAWILATLYFFVTRQGTPPNAAPARSFIFTLLGVDGLAANFQIQTMYLLGEWFLGFIILFYLVFPPLLWLVKRYPKMTAVGVLVVWIVSLALLSNKGLPTAVLLPIRLPELVFGMYLTLYLKKVPWWSVIPAAGVLAVSQAFPEEIPEDIATTFVGISAFVILTVLATPLDKQAIRTPVALIAKYSYPVFLVHHVVIMELFTRINTLPFTPLQLYMLFAAVCVITWILAIALDRITKHVIAFFTESFRREPAQI